MMCADLNFIYFKYCENGRKKVNGMGVCLTKTEYKQY